ncbi:MAG TPA: hypothetical protein VJT82_10720 [Pyrinomonadaceae bacterium]|nr:hypothetical protein [Pyrinomonadaceae bacterium]
MKKIFPLLISLLLLLPAAAPPPVAAQTPPASASAIQSPSAFVRVNPKDAEFGAKCDGRTPDDAAFERALRRHGRNIPPGAEGQSPDLRFGVRLEVPAGVCHFNNDLHITRQSIIEGQFGGANVPLSTLHFAAGKGVIIDTEWTSPETNVGGGYYTIIRDINLQGTRTLTGSTGNGVTMYARAKLENVFISSFDGDGLNATPKPGIDPNKSNANIARVDTVHVWLNGGRCWNTFGLNSSASLLTALDCSNNEGGGLYENSFLGNRHMGHHLMNNGTSDMRGSMQAGSNVVRITTPRFTPADVGKAIFIAHALRTGDNHLRTTITKYLTPDTVEVADRATTNPRQLPVYRVNCRAVEATSPNSPSEFIGMYVEGDTDVQPPARILKPNTVVGGNWGGGFTLDSTMHYSGPRLVASNGLFMQDITATETRADQITTGSVVFRDGTVQTSASSTMLSFAEAQLAGAWRPKEVNKYERAAYGKSAGRVYLRGAVEGGTAPSVIFTLPPGFRPGRVRIQPVFVNGALGLVSVNVNGDVALEIGNGWVSLDGVSFEASN